MNLEHGVLYMAALSGSFLQCFGACRHACPSGPPVATVFLEENSSVMSLTQGNDVTFLQLVQETLETCGGQCVCVSAGQGTGSSTAGGM